MVEIPEIYPTTSIKENLCGNYVWGPGSVDGRNHPVLFFPDAGNDDLSLTFLDSLLKYFFHRNVFRHAIVLDRRRNGWVSTKKILMHLSLNYIDHIEYVVVIRPQGLFQRLTSDKTVTGICNDVSFQLSVINEPKELFQLISASQVPQQIGGDLRFDVSIWVDFQIEIDSFKGRATDLGRAIQTFVGEIRCVDSLARLPADLSIFELDQERVEAFQRRRRTFARRLSACESQGVDLRKRLRELRDSSNSEEDDAEVEEEAGDSGSSSLELPVDRASLIISVEQCILQLSETRSKLRSYWNSYVRALRNLKALEEFEKRFKKFEPLLTMWQSLVESVADYLPGHSGAPRLLSSAGSFSDSSLLSAPSEEIDSALSAPPPLLEDPMEGLLATQERAKEAQAAGDALVEEISELVAQGESIGREAREALAESARVEAIGQEAAAVVVQEKRKRLSTASCSSLFARLSLHRNHEDPLVDGDYAAYADDDDPYFEVYRCDDDDYGDEGDCEDDDYSDCGKGDVQSVVTSSAATASGEIRNADSGFLSLYSPSRSAKASLQQQQQQQVPLIYRIPDYAAARVAALRQLETLAATTLDKVVSQLARLVQLYTEINEARQWVSRGNALLSPLSPEHIGMMDMAACEEAIRQLSTFADSREQNLVLKGNPGQFRKQFADLLSAEMKVELSQMLRLVEDVEHSVKVTVANLRQQISRSAYPIKPVGAHEASSPAHAIHNTGAAATDSTVSAVAAALNAYNSPSESNLEPKVLEQPRIMSPVVIAPRALNSDRLYEMALKELVITEANYVHFLEAATQAFVFEPPGGSSSLPRLPAFLKDNRSLLVVNIPEQLAFHKKYLYPQLLACNGDPFLIQHWAESSWANLVDLYTNYCMNYDRARQYAAAFESDRIHSQWISAYNNYLYRLEVESKSRGNSAKVGGSENPSHDSDKKRGGGVKALDLRKAATLNRANSCITFENKQAGSTNPAASSGQSSRGSVVEEVAEMEDEENLPPSSRKSSQGTASARSISLCRPLLSFSARLLEPAQRFQRYHLLIERLKDYVPEGQQKEALRKAHRAMLDMCDTVNVLMRFRGLMDRPSRLGRLLLQDNFTVWCAETRNGKHQRHVFLFENAILLTKLRQSNNSLVSTVLATLGGSSSGSSQTVLGMSPELQPPPAMVMNGNGAASVDGDANSYSSVATTTTAASNGGGRNGDESMSEIDIMPTLLPVESGASKPTYDIKMELKLMEVGLTPSIREDRRRFAVWTASRAQTYYFQSNNQQVRSQWVRAINDLLSAQLQRLKDDVHRKHSLVVTHASSSSSSSPAATVAAYRRRETVAATITQVSVPFHRQVAQEEGEEDDFDEQLERNGDLTVTDF